MAPIYLVLALIIQCAYIRADTDISEDKENLRETLQKPDTDNDFKPFPNWLEMLVLPTNNSMFSSSSSSMMAQVMNTNKTVEEQLNDIKEMTKQISNMLETELVKILEDVTDEEKKTDEKGARRKRSIETPMDSTKMVMRLLKHIKSNNEYQNIAIDKMMSAQEIAANYGIEFNPDPEILSDLAVAANEHAQEMTNMLQNACSLKNVTVEKVDIIPVIDEPKRSKTLDTLMANTYGIYPDSEPLFEYLPDIVSKPKPVNNIHYTDSHHHHEPRSRHHHHIAPVTPKPTFYDEFLFPYTPASDYYSYCSVEPVVMIPIDETEPEPELVGEEVEETVTSKMIVEKGDEPGTTTVNHVTSYTISEKSHFKPPQIEQLPEHFQYCFLLI